MNENTDNNLLMLDTVDAYTIIFLDTKTNITTWNKDAEKIFGYEPASIISQHFSLLFQLNELEPNELENIAANSLTGDKITYVSSLKHASGTSFNGKITIQALQGLNGQFTGFSMMVKVLIFQKNAQNIVTNVPDNQVTDDAEHAQDVIQLHYEIDKLRNNTDENYIFLDLNFNVITFSRIAYNQILYYFNVKIAKGIKIFECVDVSRKPFLNKLLNKVLNSGEKETELSIIIKNEKKHYFETTFKPTKNDEGIIDGIFISRADISGTINLKQQIEFDHTNLQALINNTDDMMWSIDTDYRLVAYNHSFYNKVKTADKKSLARGEDLLKSYYSEHSIQKWQKYYEKALNGKNFTIVEQYNDSPVSWLEISFCAITKVYEVVGVACYARDITENKKAQSILQESEERFHAFMEAFPAVAWVKDTEGRHLYLNKAWSSAFKLNVEDYIGKTEFDFVPKEIANILRENDLEVLNSGTPLDIIEEMRDLHGKYTCWHAVKFPFKNATGQTLIGGIAFDITDRKKTEADLAQSENIRSQIINSAMEAIIGMDAKGRITIWNPYAEIIFGWKAEEIIGKLVRETITVPHLRSRQDADMKNYFEEGRGILLNTFSESIAIDKNGREFPIEITVLPISQKEEVYYCAFIKDITERKNNEQKIINANRMYAFISAINKTIVHASQQQEIYNAACHIATEYGKFELAWVSTLDENKNVVKLAAHSNATEDDIEFLHEYAFADTGSTAALLNNEKYVIVNSFYKQQYTTRHEHFHRRGFKCGIALPIKTEGHVIATFNILSTYENLFDTVEIDLLEEIANDISFAVDNIRKDEKRREAENRLLYNEQRLKQAQNMANFGNWELDLQTGMSVWSEEACKIYCLSPDDNSHNFEFWQKFIHPDDIEYVMSVIEQSRNELINIDFQHRILLPTGQVKHLHSQTQFEFDKNQRPVKLYGVLHDITNQKEAELALEQSEINLRKILDMIPQGVFAKNFNGNFIFANKSFASMYYLTPDEIINRNIFDNIKIREEAEKYRMEDQEVILTGCTKLMPESIFTDLFGNERYFYTTKVPYTPAGTNEKAVLGITLEITEQKIAEQERAKMIADIVQHNKDLEQFSYIVSHNLRAPVANIIGITNILQEININVESEHKMVGHLSTSVAKLDGIIKDLNNILQIKHQLNEQKEIVHFSELVNDIKLSVDSLIKKEDVQIITDFAAIGEMTALKSYLYSIFYNLILNSIKYKQPGIRSVIDITSYLTDQKIVLKFKDNGLGINMKRSGDQIFGLYKRFHTHTEGKGMGLFMVKTQVEAMNGCISISSEVNKGTEFKIEF